MKYLKNYRVGRINNKFLLTSDTGRWVLLDNAFEKSNLGLLENKDLIITEKNKEVMVANFRNKNVFLFSGPSLHIIVLTKRCNMDCVYCHASSCPINDQDKDLSLEIAGKICERIIETKSPYVRVEFQGGEPLLNMSALKYIVKKLEKVRGKEIEFSIVSNLLLMNDEILEFLMEHDVDICTSLDGPKELHDKNRGNHDKTSNMIRKINETYKKKGINRKVSALSTITKNSLNFPKEIIDEYIRHGMDEVYLRPLNKLGDARNNLEIYYPIENFIEFWKTAIDSILEIYPERKIIEGKTKIILQKLYETRDPGYVDLRSPCGAVIGQLLYNYDGSIYTCDEGRMLDQDLFRVGNVNTALEKTICSKESCAIIRSSINDGLYCDRCVFKPFCGICPVINYAEQGSIVGNIKGSDWCKLHYAQFEHIFKLLMDEDKAKILQSWI